MNKFFSLVAIATFLFASLGSSAQVNDCGTDFVISYGAVDTWIPEFTAATIDLSVGFQVTAPNLSVPAFIINGVSFGAVMSNGDTSPLNPDCLGSVTFSEVGTYEAVITGGSSNIGGIAFTVTVTDGSTPTGGATGCTISSASNFDPNAVVDDGSCDFTLSPPSEPVTTLYTEAQLNAMLDSAVTVAIVAYAAEFETASAALALEVANATDNLDAEIEAHALTQAQLDDMTIAFDGASTTITSLSSYVSFWIGEFDLAADELAVASATVDQLQADLDQALLDLASAEALTAADLTNCERADMNGDGAFTTSDLIVMLGFFGESCE